MIAIPAYLYIQGDRIKTMRYKFPDMPACEKSLKSMRFSLPKSASGDFEGFVVAHCAFAKSENFYTVSSGWMDVTE